MMTVRRSHERGHFNHGWLDTFHTFSFAGYYDPDHMGFRGLRVINEDRVDPGMGFGMHGHRDMEIVTLVLSGRLQHRDSLGHGAALAPGELQRITAGSGIRHSEFNPSDTEPVHLYQIWLAPEREGLPPGYEQRAFPAEGKAHGWLRVAGHDGEEGSLRIRADAEVFVTELQPGVRRHYDLKEGRHAWLQVLRGGVTVGGTTLHDGDGLAVSEESRFAVIAVEPSELLLFDLA